MAKRFDYWLNKQQLKEERVETENFSFEVSDDPMSRSFGISNVKFEGSEIETDTSPIKMIMDLKREGIDITDEQEEQIISLVQGHYEEISDKLSDECEKILETAYSLIESKVQSYYTDFNERVQSELQKFKGGENNG